MPSDLKIPNSDNSIVRTVLQPNSFKWYDRIIFLNAVEKHISCKTLCQKILNVTFYWIEIRLQT